MTHTRKIPAALGLATLVALGLAAATPAQAQIAGFGDGTNFTLNHTGGGPAASISGGVLQLTQAVNDSDNSAWDNTLQNAGAFHADFTYTPGSGATADGFTFAVQNNGLTSLGGGGSALGYAGTNGTAGYTALTHSAAVGIDLYANGNTDAHTGVIIPNGTIALNFGVDSNLPIYFNTGLLASGGAVAVDIVSTGQSLTANLNQGGNLYSYTYGLDVPQALGGQTATVGFTGATGGLSANQQISNFTFTPTAPASNFVTVTSPTDAITVVDGTGPVPAGGDTPGAEPVTKVIDQDPSTKYLNFTGPGSGFIVTPAKGSTIVTGLELTAANDTPGRDPATFTFLGSNNNGLNFTQIATGAVGAFTDRYSSQFLSFTNSTAYTTYEVLFPTLAGVYDPNTPVNSMQIADVGLLAVAAPEPGATASLLLGGCSLLGLIARRKRRAA